MYMARGPAEDDQRNDIKDRTGLPVAECIQPPGGLPPTFSSKDGKARQCIQRPVPADAVGILRARN